jgi:hypothetical protein
MSPSVLVFCTGRLLGRFVDDRQVLPQKTGQLGNAFIFRQSKCILVHQSRGVEIELSHDASRRWNRCHWRNMDASWS